MIVPCESHFTDWTSDCCCPSHWIQRLTGTLCPAERLPYHTGSGVQQLFTNGGALIAFLRTLEWGTFILLLACGCLLLSALHPCLASSGIFPGTSIPSPHPVFRQEVRPSAGKLCWHPGCPAQLKEEGHFFPCGTFVGIHGEHNTYPGRWGAKDCPTSDYRVLTPPMCGSFFEP